MDCSPPGSLSMKFSRLEHWDGLPFPLSGDLPDQGIETASPALAGGFFTTEPPGKPKDSNTLFIIKLFRYILFDYSVLPKSTWQSHPGYHSFSILHSHKHNSSSDLNIEILHQALFRLCFTLLTVFEWLQPLLWSYWASVSTWLNLYFWSRLSPQLRIQIFWTSISVCSSGFSKATCQNRVHDVPHPHIYSYFKTLPPICVSANSAMKFL